MQPIPLKRTARCYFLFATLTLSPPTSYYSSLSLCLSISFLASLRRSLSLPISLLCILSFPVLAVSSGIYDTDRPFQTFSPFPSFSSPPLFLLFSFSLLPPLCLSLSSGALSIRAPIEFLRLKCGHTNLMALSNRDALDPV